jgi:GTP cyclohydrolase I
MSNETKNNDMQIENAVRQILLNVGEAPDREGLRGTPFRVRKMYEELVGGYKLEHIHRPIAREV